MNLKLIYSNKGFMNYKTKRMLCDSLVLSHFTYADSLYSPFLSAALKQRVQRVQNACLRLLYGLKRREHVSYKLIEAGWLNMASRWLLNATLFYNKILSLHKPAYLYNKISYRSDVHTLNLRFKGNLTPPVHKTQFFKNSFTYQLFKIGNFIIRLIGEGDHMSAGRLKRAIRDMAVAGRLEIEL